LADLYHYDMAPVEDPVCPKVIGCNANCRYRIGCGQMNI